MNQFERNGAEQLDRYLLAHQQGRQPAAPSTLNPAERRLVDQLLKRTMAEQPDPAFVTMLERQLHTLAATQTSSRRSMPFWRQLVQMMTALPQPLRLAVTTVWLLVLLSGGLLLSVPTARATVWAWLYGFGLVDKHTVEHRPIIIAAPVINPTAPHTMSLVEIQQKAPFVVSTPAWLPPGVQYSGGFVSATATGSQVSLIYHYRVSLDEPLTPTTPFLLLVITHGFVAGAPLLPDEQAQTTTVGGYPALYVHGSWVGRLPQTAGERATNLQWDKTLDAAWLSWQAADLTYLLYAQDLQLTQTDLTHVAESLHANPH